MKEAEDAVPVPASVVAVTAALVLFQTAQLVWFFVLLVGIDGRGDGGRGGRRREEKLSGEGIWSCPFP